MDTMNKDEEEIDEEEIDEREALESIIKSSFISSGGSLSLVKDAMLPIRLSDLTIEELQNICDNISLQEARNQKQMMTARALESVSNVLSTFSSIFGIRTIQKGIDAFNTDKLLRESLVKCFIGKGVNPPPKAAVAVALSSHVTYFLSEFVKAYVEQYNSSVQSVDRQGTGTDQLHSRPEPGDTRNPSPGEDPGHGQVPIRKDNSGRKDNTVPSTNN